METEPKDWRGVMGINLYPAIEVSRHAVPHLKAQGGGAIVLITATPNATRTRISGIVASGRE